MYSVSRSSVLRRTLLLLAPLAAACGHPEQAVVDKYFAAINAKDNQTLSNFALVSFDQAVSKWVVVGTLTEKEEDAPLPGLLKAQQEAQAKLDDNKKKYTEYRMAHFEAVEEVRELLKNDAKIPPKLQTTADDWKGFTEAEKELKKTLADTTSAVEKEKRHVLLSTGPMDDIEDLEGKLLLKEVELDLTLEAGVQKYNMGLRRYDLKPAGGVGKVMSRWVVVSLTKVG